MKKFSATVYITAAFFTASFLARAETSTQSEAEFKPYKLVGEWQFQNTETGTKYGGPIQVQIEGVDQKGVMRGKISYDGRQTNDMCGTKSVFSDSPVPAEIIKTGLDYTISFETKCIKGQSPRLFSWLFSCDQQGACSAPSNQPWGKGMRSLKEVR